MITEMNSQSVVVLRRLNRNLLEIGRLMTNENYNSARVILVRCKTNLNRIADRINSTRYNTLNNNITALLNICEDKCDAKEQENSITYRADRIIKGQSRPSVFITRDQLKQFLLEGYTATKIAKRLNCSKSVVYKRMYEEGLKFRNKYTPITDEELHRKIEQLNIQFPNSGSEMMSGYLRGSGIFVTRSRVRKILSNVDPLGTASRWSCAVQRRTYSVPTPNALWHIDAHLKLVRWGIVTHGCIDGYSRLVIYVKCTTSITAQSLINIFMPAIVKYGVPSRVRSDHGYENLFVAVLMNLLRGFQRASHITGRSVHNQRIERLWRDVYYQVICTFYEQFHNLETEGILDPNNVKHRYALQLVYVKEINKALSTFQKAWNHHKIRTAGRKTPKELWLEGVLKNINSRHTSIMEIFNNEQTIEERVRIALATRGVNLDTVVIDTPSVDYSSLTARVNLSNDQQQSIENVMQSNSSPKEKYISCIQVLVN